ELPGSVARGDEDITRRSFAQALYAGDGVRQWVLLRRPRPPAPHALRSRNPQGALLVLVKTNDAETKTAFCTGAVRRGISHAAQNSGCSAGTADPQRALPVLNQCIDESAVKLRIGVQRGAVPTRQPCIRPNPKCAVARYQRGPDATTGK